MEERRAGRFKTFADALNDMGGRVVHEDEASRPQRGDEHLFEMGE